MQSSNALNDYTEEVTEFLKVSNPEWFDHSKYDCYPHGFRWLLPTHSWDFQVSREEFLHDKEGCIKLAAKYLSDVLHGSLPNDRVVSPAFTPCSLVKYSDQAAYPVYCTSWGDDNIIFEGTFSLLPSVEDEIPVTYHSSGTVPEEDRTIIR